MRADTEFPAPVPVSNGRVEIRLPIVVNGERLMIDASPMEADNWASEIRAAAYAAAGVSSEM